jgi:hypothetical protein
MPNIVRGFEMLFIQKLEIERLNFKFLQLLESY